ncbi:MAG TPA: rod shape-determining protein RodA [Saprospiraceae bacterium]|nr:rod shape-determining protein RodA [Saprospiraceae bacterium]
MNKRAVQNETGRVDWVVLSLYLALVAIGWTMIYAVSHDRNTSGSILSLDYNGGRQMIWIGISLFILFFILVFDSKIWRTFSYGFYAIGTILLILVLFFGKVINGQKAWFGLGMFTFQPAEIAKFGTALALANLLSDYKMKLSEPRAAMVAISLVLLPPLLIMLQPDAGSALVFFSFFILLFREGLNASLYIIILSFAGLFILSLLFGFDNTYLVILIAGLAIMVYHLPNRLYYMLAVGMLGIGGFIAVNSGNAPELLGVLTGILLVLAGILVWKKKSQLVFVLVSVLTIASLTSFFSNFVFNILEPHQQERINVWLHPERCDPRGSLYNVLQSKMAIGSGGLSGKGFLNGTLTKLNYVPEQTTDFIFCTVGEEHGFIGTLIVISLYLTLLLRLSFVAERQRLNFSRNYIWGVTGILFFHFLINIGMTMGLVPIIGIPLPFVSYGGSSLIGFTVLLGVVIKLDSIRNKD